MKIVKCVKKGKDLKVVPVDEEGNVQFPKGLRVEGKMFAVEDLIKGDKFWKTKGQIFELVAVSPDKKKETSNEQYVQFTEHNDYEGETWHNFAPLSMKGVKELMELIDSLDSEFYEYKLVTKQVAETLSAQEGDTTYMPQYSMVKAIVPIPDAVDEEEKEEHLYKARCFE